MHLQPPINANDDPSWRIRHSHRTTLRQLGYGLFVLNVSFTRVLPQFFAQAAISRVFLSLGIFSHTARLPLHSSSAPCVDMPANLSSLVPWVNPDQLPSSLLI